MLNRTTIILIFLFFRYLFYFYISRLFIFQSFLRICAIEWRNGRRALRVLKCHQIDCEVDLVNGINISQCNNIEWNIIPCGIIHCKEVLHSSIRSTNNTSQMAQNSKCLFIHFSAAFICPLSSKKLDGVKLRLTMWQGKELAILPLHFSDLFPIFV